MEIKGKIEFISALTKGTDKNGKEYEKAYFVINDEVGQYPNKYKIDLFNKTNLMQGVTVGSHATVQANGSVNEYEGKHFGSLNLYKIEVYGQQATAPPPVVVPPMGSGLPPSDINGEGSGLPF